MKPNPASLVRKALKLADEAARSELTFGLTMPSLSSELPLPFQGSSPIGCTCIDPGLKVCRLSASDRESLWLTLGSGT